MTFASASLSSAAAACQAKMLSIGVSDSCVHTFLTHHAVISSGTTCDIPENTITPIDSLDSHESLSVTADTSLLKQVVVLKLNGGLGTSMGLQGAKTLLDVKNGKNFLDFAILQIENLRKTQSDGLRFMLMNSFSTSVDTKKYLQNYPWLYNTFESEVELIQNRVPKIRQDNLFPVVYEANPLLEWAPPGHGDLYTVLYSSGKLEELLRSGYRYMFVSNGDNLGATLDLKLLAYMHANQLEFLMEVCHRTDSDKKGGHLAKAISSVDSTLDSNKSCFILREIAQCSKGDEISFQDVTKHRFFNTNNLWVDLAALQDVMKSNGGILPLPVIQNAKTVNPVDSSSTKVYQLETAMGAAISFFKRSAAVVVSRERFSPVKTCSELLAIWSDAYIITEDHRIVLCDTLRGKPPTIDLDSKHYKTVAGLQNLVKNGVPSLRHCKKLTVRGLVEFGSGVVVKGEVTIQNNKSDVLVIKCNTVLMDEVVEA